MSWRSACRNFAEAFPTPEIWEHVRSFVPVHTTHPWQLSRHGLGRLVPPHVSWRIWELIPMRVARVNTHLLTGIYPGDFQFPGPMEEWVPVRNAWWVNMFPLGPDPNHFFLWLVDGFPVWIRNRLYRQVEPHELPPWANVEEYWQT